MNKSYRVVKLLKNHLYPTYQLHAFMANKKTSPQGGLRLAALITMDWLRQRLGENAPDELQSIPHPDSYKELDDSCLIPLHMKAGFGVDIISLPQQGIWSLQISEPDLGADPGNPNQERPAMPGRIIETNIGVRITNGQLECGFKIIISDVDSTTQLCEVYRLAVIRQLIGHPSFGLKQITYLDHDVKQIKTVEQLNFLNEVWRNESNHLPCVIFTYIRREDERNALQTQSIHLLRQPSFFTPPISPVLPCKNPASVLPPYNIADFARHSVTYCRTYLLADTLFDRFNSVFKLAVDPGDIVILEPACFGAGIHIIPYKPSKIRQTEVMERLRCEICTYSRNKHVDFGQVAFLADAHELQRKAVDDAHRQSVLTSDQWRRKMASREEELRAELQKRDTEIDRLSKQLERQLQYQERIEQEKGCLREECEQVRTRCNLLIEQKEEEIAYLNRKLARPNEHSEVAAWVASNFSGRVLLHDKAIRLLDEKASKQVNIELLCDALDFLATDYWARRYQRIPTDEMNNRCSEKYGRPFEVTPVGSTTIEFTPVEYKVKYFLGAQSKPVESALDFHLRVGNDVENLLRIYFLHDDEKQVIVVGSLPCHLTAVTIKKN